MINIKSKKRVAVIAAGGYAKRMASLSPKSFMKIGEKTYLEVLMGQICQIRFDAILIYCNRSGFLEKINDITKTYENVSVVFDRGVTSTIEIVKHASSIFSKCEFVFFYGHSPRCESDIIKLLDKNYKCVFSVYNNSTKKNSVMSNNGGFIEPPLKFDSSFVDISNYNTWETFIDSLNNDYVGININAPAEFNTQEEQIIYNKYIESWNYDKEPNLTIGSTRRRGAALR